MVWKEIISLIVGIIVGGFAKYFWDRLILAHEYKLKTINDRIDEFVIDSKKYFGPLALASGDLSQTLVKMKPYRKKKEHSIGYQSIFIKEKS